MGFEDIRKFETVMEEMIKIKYFFFNAVNFTKARRPKRPNKKGNGS